MNTARRRPVASIVDELDRAVDQQRSDAVLSECEHLRERVAEMLQGRALETEDPVLAKRRRLHHRLEVLEAKAEAGRFRDAAEDMETIAPLAKTLAGEIEALAHTQRPLDGWAPPWLSRLAAIVEREATTILKGPRGLVLALVSFATFVLALQAGMRTTPPSQPGLDTLWARARIMALALAPIAGIVVGFDAVERDVRNGRIHLLAARPVTRGLVVAGKATGALLALAVVLVGPALLIAGFAFAFTGRVGTPGFVLAFPVGLFGLAAAYAALAMSLDALATTRVGALTGALAAFVFLGPVWEQAFRAGSPGAGVVSPTASTQLVYLLSPQAAFNAVLDSFAPTGGAGGGGTVFGLVALLAWTGTGIAWVMKQARDHGFRRSPAGVDD